MKKELAAHMNGQNKNDTNNTNANRHIKANKTLKELLYLYLESLAGHRISHKLANDDLYSVASTANLSRIRHHYGIFINHEWVTNPHNDTRYKVFWLSGENLIKAEYLLRYFGLL